MNDSKHKADQAAQMEDNLLSYQELEWIIDHSDYGLYFLIASESMQKQVLERYKTANILIYDWRYHPHPKGYSFADIWILVMENPNVNAYCFLNFQYAVLGDNDVKQFNFSRDMLMDLRKNFVFCMTQDTDDKLNQTAYDFYSYVKLFLNIHDDPIG